jgi:hypothetical protein
MEPGLELRTMLAYDSYGFVMTGVQDRFFFEPRSHLQQRLHELIGLRSRYNNLTAYIGFATMMRAIGGESDDGDTMPSERSRRLDTGHAIQADYDRGYCVLFFMLLGNRHIGVIF